MSYCSRCGTELIMKEHPHEGTVPYCSTCGRYIWPGFNTAVSLVVLNSRKDRILLIQQYGRPQYVLVAGYVNRGEDAEDAVLRELREETGAEASEIRFNHSRYFPPSNTLMLNFTAVLKDDTLHPNYEVDSWRWFTFEEARQNIKPGSLAEAFLKGWLDGVYSWPRYDA